MHQDLYIELNKAQPVLEIDVPDVIATSKKVSDQLLIVSFNRSCMLGDYFMQCIFESGEM